MPENDRLNDCLSEIKLGFVEREATSEQFMELGIQLHLRGPSLSNTISVLDKFGVDRARSTVHNWVQKADLQPKEGRNPDHVAVDETVIQLNNERYWLYAAVDSETNDLLHTKLEPVRTNAFAHAFFAELREKHDVDDAVFLVDGAAPLQDACSHHGLDYRYEKHGNRNSAERVFREVNDELPVSLTVSATQVEKLLTSGYDRSPSHGTSLSEYYPVQHQSTSLTANDVYLWAGMGGPSQAGKIHR